MPAYHITGPWGTGKSYVGEELSRRKFKVVETDFEPGLAAWINKETGQKVANPPWPHQKQWVENHTWEWDTVELESLMNQIQDEPVFFVGHADNEQLFYGMFQERFALFVDTATIVKRLQGRDPVRWANGTAELQKAIRENEPSKAYNARSGAILIDSSVPVEIVADTILSYIA